MRLIPALLPKVLTGFHSYFLKELLMAISLSRRFSRNAPGAPCGISPEFLIEVSRWFFQNFLPGLLPEDILKFLQKFSQRFSLEVLWQFFESLPKLNVCRPETSFSQFQSAFFNSSSWSLMGFPPIPLFVSKFLPEFFSLFLLGLLWVDFSRDLYSNSFQKCCLRNADMKYGTKPENKFKRNFRMNQSRMSNAGRNF